MKPTITLYSTYCGLTQKAPNWEDCYPFEALRGVETFERACVTYKGLVRISGRESEVILTQEEWKHWEQAPFEIFKGEGFEIISRRYA